MRHPKIPIDHTCDGADRQRCRCVQQRKNERKREQRRARGLQQRPIEHSCDGTNLRSCACAVARHREQYVPGSTHRRELKKRYGMTPEQWQALHDDQGGRCAACGRHEDEVLWDSGRRGLVVDHCHSGGQVRALLCLGCNNGIGFFGDDPDRLEAAAAWLRSLPAQ